MDNHFNEVFPSFVPLHSGHRVIDIFSSQFSFHLSSKHKDNNFKAHIQQLDNLAIKSLSMLLSLQMLAVRNRSATEPVMLKVHNVKLSFNI